MSAPPDVEQRWVSPAEVVALTGYAEQTLQNWRSARTGPPFKKVNGRLIKYWLPDLVKWLDSQPSTTS